MRLVWISGAVECRSHRRVACALALAVGVFATAAAATDFPVTGTISINGSTGPVPDGTFQGSSYDPVSGAIGAGTFKFPQATVTQGSNSLTYQLSQTGTSTGQVDANGVATYSNAVMSVTLISGTTALGPANFGSSCVFTPINVMLSGTGSSAGIDVSSQNFTIPQTTDTCNGWASLINPQVSGSVNSIQLHLDGDFTPPGIIFVDGFDSSR